MNTRKYKLSATQNEAKVMTDKEWTQSHTVRNKDRNRKHLHKKKLHFVDLL